MKCFILNAFDRAKNILLKKKAFLPAVFAVVAVFCSVPFYYAKAFWPAVIAVVGPSVLAGVSAITSKLITGATIFIFLMNFIVRMGGFLLSFGEQLIIFALRNPFGFSMTNPADNQIIAIGWTLMRDFTNMLFVLGLAYIGLATALGFLSFDTKKAFKNLLIVALLVNFSPVICGAIVDVSNIGLHFLLKEPSFAPLIETYRTQTMDLDAQCGGITHWNDTQCWAKTLLLGSYGLGGGYILVSFGLLLLLRFVIIWVLVILSPLAFFASIFNKTSAYFKQWWKQFLNWSIIVIPGAFFLYLSQQIMMLAQQGSLITSGRGNGFPLFANTIPQVNAQVIGTGADDFFLILAPFLIAILFMGFGFKLTKSISAAGAGTILGYVSRVQGKVVGFGRGMARRIGKSATPLAGKAVAGVGAGFAGGAKGLGEGLATPSGTGFWKTVGSGVKGGALGAFTKRGREEGKRETLLGLERMGVAPVGYAEEKMGKRYNIEEQQKKMKEASEDRLREMSQSALRRGADDKTIGAALAALKQQAENGDLTGDDLNIFQKATRKGIAIPSSVEKAIKKSRPDWAGEFLSQDKLAKKVRDYAKENAIDERELGDPDRMSEIEGIIRDNEIISSVEKSDPKAFRENVQTEAFMPSKKSEKETPEQARERERRNAIVISALSEKQISEYGVRASTAKKNKLSSAINTDAMVDENGYIEELKKNGKRGEENLKRLEHNLDQILNDPNISGKVSGDGGRKGKGINLYDI